MTTCPNCSHRVYPAYKACKNCSHKLENTSTELQYCGSCRKSKRLNLFSPDSRYCKSCVTHKRNSRSKRIQLATPNCQTSSDREKIRAIYEKSALITQETGIPHEVDHIIPIKNEEVCGLHVPQNLQIVSRDFNRRKKNSFLTYQTLSLNEENKL